MIFDGWSTAKSGVMIRRSPTKEAGRHIRCGCSKNALRRYE
jgi:hypothetical protein